MKYVFYELNLSAGLSYFITQLIDVNYALYLMTRPACLYTTFPNDLREKQFILQGTIYKQMEY